MEYAIGALVCFVASAYAAVWAGLFVPTCGDGIHVWLYALWDRPAGPPAPGGAAWAGLDNLRVLR